MAAHRMDVAGARRGIVLVLAAITGTWGLFEAWHRASLEAELKMSQKIFYFHAPLGICCLVLTLVAAVAGAAYLWRRRPAADLLSESCMEVVLVSCGVVLITGMLWAKPAWGDWFPWGEPRLTGMLVLFLIALAYTVLRSSVDEAGRRARFSAVMALVGAVDAVIAYSAIHLWNTTHPTVFTAKKIGLPPDMLRAFLICLVAMALLTWALVETRLGLATLRSQKDELGHRVREFLEDAS